MLDVRQVVIGIAIAAFVTFFTRVVPFAFFTKRKPSAMIMYVQSYIPPMTMVILVVYCLKDIDWGAYPHGIPALLGVAVTAVLHLWKRNALVSILTGTALYMFLIRIS